MKLSKLIAASLSVAVLLCLGLAARAQSDIVPFTDRAAFNATSARRSTIDFEAIAPAKGFGKYPAAEGLTASGTNFRASGGAKFGPGMVYVPSAHYTALNPMYPAGAGAVLTWSPPNQPGNASLDVTLPRGATAIGAEVWTMQPYASTIEVTARTIDGKAQTITVNANRPAGSFIGFTSDADIISVSFRIPKGQAGLILDNFVMGRATGAGQSSSTTALAVPPRPDEGKRDAQPSRPPAPQTSQPAISQKGRAPASPVGQSAVPPVTTGGARRGAIAYVRGGKEIRLIELDGTNDRRLWTHADATDVNGIHELAWRPDGRELAFSSGHNEIFSIYHADIYAIKPDGTGLRKLTNAPDRSDLARYPKGSVSVTVRNDQPLYKQSNATTGIFIIYVAGADEPQQVLLLPGASKTLLFKSVADFGDHAQAVVAIQGGRRWLIPGMDVQAGRVTKAPAFSISGDGIELFGAFRPVWRNDNSRISYRSGLCVISTTPADSPAVGHTFNPLFGGENPPSWTCAWDWGPTPALANQIIYTAGKSDEDSGVFRITEGGAHPGVKLASFLADEYQLLQDVRWLPDGSGFLFSSASLTQGAGNIFRHDFATKRTTQLTNLEDNFTGAISISPDGRWVVFERTKSLDDENVDLWMVRTDGTSLRLLVRNGKSPAW